MELETINALACCLDDVYNNASESSTRKVTSKLEGNIMTLTFQTIANIARENHMHMEAARLKEEGAKMINDKVKIIKKMFKENSSSSLKLKKQKEYDHFETISVSAFSPIRVIKYCFSVSYEVN